MQDQEVISIISDWVGNYLAKSHPELGRLGSVCPFVPEAIDRNTLNIRPVHLSGDRIPEMEKVVLNAKEEFQEIEKGNFTKALYHSTLLVFPELASEAGYAAVEQVKNTLKPVFVGSGLMLGEFYAGNSVSGLHNPDFHPLNSPLPMLVIRHMVVSDIAFLNNPAETLSRRIIFLKSYLAHQRLPAAERQRIAAILADLEEQMRKESMLKKKVRAAH